MGKARQSGLATHRRRAWTNSFRGYRPAPGIPRKTESVSSQKPPTAEEGAFPDCQSDR